MILKRVGVLSVGKIMGAIYAVIGLLIGAIISLVSVLGATLGGGHDALPGMVGGVAAIILVPILYGVLGFLGGLLMAALYNLAASVMGGVELEFQQPSGGSWGTPPPAP